MRFLVAFFWVACSFLSVVSAQVISLDESFGVGGKVVNSFFSGTDMSKSVVIQSDGKILVCGNKRFSISGNLYIARYNQDGSLDNTFGVNGIVFTALTTEDAGNCAMKLLADGKILVVSSKSISNNAHYFNFCLARYNSDGTIDNTFGTNGLVETDINSVGNIGRGIALQNDGKIIVAGNSYTESEIGGTVITLVRYTQNGTIDTTFGTNGVLIINPMAPGSNNSFCNIKTLSDDSILIGIITDVGEIDTHYTNSAIYKIQSNGVVDTAFGTNGYVFLDLGAFDVVQSVDEYQGSIYLAGFSKNISGASGIMLAKYSSNGVLDSTFGNAGIVKVNKDAGSIHDGVYDMKMLSNGKLLCSGWTGNLSATDALLIQFNADGSIDTHFNQTGYVSIDVDNLINSFASFTFQPDGKIVGVGWAGTEYAFFDSVLVRYNVETLSQNNFEGKRSFSVSPNPFVQKLLLKFDLDNSTSVMADLLDSNGRKIHSLIEDQFFSSGKNIAECATPESLSKGVYFVRLTTPTSVETIKVLK